MVASSLIKLPSGTPGEVQFLETYAFRRFDFAFIDVASGPLTNIALADDTAQDLADVEMLPPIRVRCLKGQVETPFEFFTLAPN
jgi:hypothetical protein